MSDLIPIKLAEAALEAALEAQANTLEKKMSQLLDIVADLIHQQKEVASINSQLQRDLQEAELRLRCIEAWRANYTSKHPGE